MSQTDRVTGLVGYSGMKVPVRVATTAAIVLSGEQTIDGVAVVTADRVLVKDQASSIANGIYVADTGAWDRAQDADGPYDIRNGSLVLVASGTASGGKVYKASCTDPLVLGTGAITFSQALFSGLTGVTFTQAGAGAVARAAQDKMRDIVSVQDFGAVGDGVTNDKAAIQAAFDTGAGCVYFPNASGAAAYKIDTDVTVTTSVCVLGNNSSMTGAGRLIFQGSAAEVGAINAAAGEGDKVLVVTANTGIASNDLIEINDTVNSSWAPYSVAYRAGEFAKVLSVAGATGITLQGGLEGAYASAATSKVYKVTPIRVSIDNLRCLGTGTQSLVLRYCEDLVLRNVKTANGTESALLVESCYNAEIINPDAYCNAAAAGLQYGIVVSQSQQINVRGGSSYGTRHGVAMGTAGRMPSRKVIVDGTTISAAAAAAAADFHGSTADCRYVRCRVNGGVSFGGKDNSVDDCHITGTNTAGQVVQFGEMVGGTLALRGSKIDAIDTFAFTTFINNAADEASQLLDSVIEIDDVEFVSQASIIKIMQPTWGAAAGVDRSWRVNNVRVTGVTSGIIGAGTGFLVGAVVTTAPPFVWVKDVVGMPAAMAMADWVKAASGSLAASDVRIPNVTGLMTPTFAAGNFTANGAQTWTVDAGDVLTYAWAFVADKVMLLTFDIITSSVGGVADSNLIIAVPGGYTIKKNVENMCWVQDNATAKAGVVLGAAGESAVRIQCDVGGTNWAAAANATRVRGQIMFEVN